jgi:hypothetical protein
MASRRRVTARDVVLCAALAVTGASCGVPVSSAPHGLPKSALPQALVQKQQAQAGGAIPAHAVRLHIYLIQEPSQQLVHVNRYQRPPITVQTVLDQLEAGPLAADFQQNYESALPAESHLEAVGAITKSGTATIRLDSSFGKQQGQGPVDELAQIVWSVQDSLRNVRRVRFVESSGDISVEIGNGNFVGRPVSLADFPFAPPLSSANT